MEHSSGQKLWNRVLFLIVYEYYLIGVWHLWFHSYYLLVTKVHFVDKRKGEEAMSACARTILLLRYCSRLHTYISQKKLWKGGRGGALGWHHAPSQYSQRNALAMVHCVSILSSENHWRCTEWPSQCKHWQRSSEIYSAWLPCRRFQYYYASKKYNSSKQLPRVHGKRLCYWQLPGSSPLWIVA